MGDRAANFEDDTTEAVSIATHGLIWRLEILTPETTCGVEIQPVFSNRFEQRPDGAGFVGRLYVSEGSVRVVDSAGEAVTVNKLDTIQLPLGADDNEPTEQIRSVPEWVVYELPTMPSGTRRYAKLFEKEFITKRSVVGGLYPRVNDRRPQMAELATQCLATIGDSESLVRALSETEHEEARQAAIDGIRSWLQAPDDNNDEADKGKKLKALLGEFFHDRMRDDVYRLLWGFNKQDGQDPDISRELVNWLDSEHAAVRQMAFQYIREMTGKTHQYGPSRPIGQREKSFSNWVRQLDRDGTLVPESEEE